MKTLSGKVDRLLLKTMSALSLKAQISGGKAASVLATRSRRRVPPRIRQRVEDNAFHPSARLYSNVELPL